MPTSQSNVSITAAAAQSDMDKDEIVPLFDVVDTLAGHYRLRVSLSDPAIEVSQRVDMARQLFGDHLSEKAMDLFAELVSESDETCELDNQLETWAICALLRCADEMSEIQTQLFSLARMIESDHDLEAMLRDDAIDVEQRREFLTSLLNSQLDQITLILLARAVKNQRGSAVNILDGYVSLAAQIRHRRVCIVTVPIRPTDQQRQRIIDELERIYGSLDCQIRIDSSIIGGGRVEIGDQIFDATYAKKLDELSSSLEN